MVPHPATLSLPGLQQAQCVAEFIPHAYSALAKAIDELLLTTGSDEWSAEELIAEHGSAGAPYRLPLEELVLFPRASSTEADAATVDAATAPLRLYARSTVNKLNKLNAWLHAQRLASQITSAELTFQLNRTHFAREALLFHVDHGLIDPASAVFVVGLRDGSRPTLLHTDPATRASVEACATASIHDPDTAACPSEAAGAASYFSLHHCHARPSHEQPETRRDVLTVHVRWSHPPASEVWTRGWHETDACSGDDTPSCVESATDPDPVRSCSSASARDGHDDR